MSKGPIENYLSEFAYRIAENTNSLHCSIFLIDRPGKLVLRATTASHLSKLIGNLHYLLPDDIRKEEPLTVRALRDSPVLRQPGGYSQRWSTFAVDDVLSAPSGFLASPIPGPDTSPIGVVRVIRESSASPFDDVTQNKFKGDVRELGNFVSALDDNRESEQRVECIYTVEHPNIVLASNINQELIRQLSNDPQALFKISPRTFEELIAELLKRDGWSTELTLQTRDGGYDIRAVRRLDDLEFSLLVQAKRHRFGRPVGVSVLRELYAIKQRHHASKALIATTSHVTKQAKLEFDDVIPWELELREYSHLVSWIRRNQAG